MVDLCRTFFVPFIMLLEKIGSKINIYFIRTHIFGYIYIYIYHIFSIAISQIYVYEDEYSTYIELLSYLKLFEFQINKTLIFLFVQNSYEASMDFFLNYHKFIMTVYAFVGPQQW